jgi:TATA-box binding protein (TBP) (component of TFIID and TFIIIB)
MTTARSQFSALLLTSGKVLVAGGKATAGVALASSELYDPTAGTWSTVGSLNNARFQATMTALDSGQVLITGGNSGSTALASAELFDQTLSAWGNTGSLMAARF